MVNVKKVILLLALIFLVTMTANVEAADSNLEPLAVGHVEGENQALMLVQNKTDGQLFFMLIEAETKSFALVPFEEKIYNFYLNKTNGGYSPAIFLMMTSRQNDTSDDALGMWNDDMHVIPVYALFNVQDGQIICERFCSGEGSVTPSHYHSDIKNPVHIKLIETLLTKMPLLHEDVQAKGIQLP